MTKSGEVRAKRKLSKLLHGDEAGSRRRDALLRLSVTEQQLNECGDISSLLKMGKGGLTGTLQALRFSVAHEAESFLKKYDETPERDRQSVPWEAIALAAGVQPSSLLGVAILAIQAYSANAVKIIALTHHPQVAEARVKFALQEKGGADRAALDTSLGFLPTTRGNSINLNFGFGEKPNRLESDSPMPTLPAPTDDGREGDLGHLFPSLSNTQDSLVPNSVKTLEA